MSNDSVWDERHSPEVNAIEAVPIWIDGRPYEPDYQEGSLIMLKPVIEKKWWEFWK